MATLLDLRFDEAASSTTAIDVGGATAENGTYTGDAAPDGSGLATFDGDDDYVEVAADPLFGLSEGTIVVTFTQDTASLSDLPFGGNAAMTLISVDSTGFDAGGHLSIFVRSDGQVAVRHQDDANNYNYSGGSVTLGQPTTVAYSWGPSGSTLIVDGVVVDSGVDALVLAGDVEPIVVGASQAISGDGVADNIQGSLDGTIDRVIITDTASSGSVPCFTAGTLIETAQGERAIETLTIGGLVKTGTGFAPIKWIGRWTIPEHILEARPNLRPIVFEPHSIGNTRRLKLSRQHCVVMRLDMQDVLVRAGHLAKHGRGRIRVSHSEQKVSYYHILLERHETLFANGVMAESLYPQSLSFEFARPAELAQTQTEPNTVLPVLSSAAVRHALRNGRLKPPLDGECEYDDSAGSQRHLKLA